MKRDGIHLCFLIIHLYFLFFSKDEGIFDVQDYLEQLPIH